MLLTEQISNFHNKDKSYEGRELFTYNYFITKLLVTIALKFLATSVIKTQHKQLAMIGFDIRSDNVPEQMKRLNKL